MFDIFFGIVKIIFFMASPVFVLMAAFAVLCFGWVIWYRVHDGRQLPRASGSVKKRHGVIRQMLCDVPRRYVQDLLDRDPDTFGAHGIHMFCGEQGSGKTIAAVEMMLRLKEQYPAALMTTNFAVEGEDHYLSKWQDLLTYNNGSHGVICGIDEIQNWFASGRNQLPEGMLEIVTQNRKNRRVLCCTAQVFTRVSKGIREQVRMVYQPHTILGCWTIVIKRRPVFDSEGNVTDLKYRGMYSFVHTPELRSAYDTYRVIHRLAVEGFKPRSEREAS